MSGQSNSSFLHVPQSQPQTQPQTPRTSGNNNGRVRVTPSFSFGLGFSPSFNFSSPRNMGMLNSLSPQRFFSVSNNLTKAVEEGKKEEDVAEERPAERVKGGSNSGGNGSISGRDIFHSLTPPDSSRTSNKFLDSLTLSLQNKQEGAADDTVNTQADSIDVWSSIENDNSTQNISTLTSIYEDMDENKENTNAFLTPNRLLLNKPVSGSKLVSAPRLKVLKAKALDNYMNTNGRVHDPLADLPKKKRRIALTGADESPNKSIASRIDSSFQSPERRKSTCSETSETSDKVWWQELDEVLMKCYAKYKSFRENQSFDSSTLKNTSQNKVLSRMVFTKTGVNRSAKQVSSRLFRLSKQGKLSKDKLSLDSESDMNEYLNDIIKTPLESLISSSQSDSNNDNEMIDREVNQLWSSPPIHSTKNIAYSTKRSNSKNSDHQEEFLIPKEFTFKFVSSKNGESHSFTSLGKISDSSITETSLKKRLKNDSVSCANTILEHNVPLVLVCNEINLDIRNSIFEKVERRHNHKQTNLFDGNFESFMKIETSSNNKSDAIINWLCSIKVFTGDDLLFENIVVTNGYHNSTNYELHVPFLKDFWKGYLSFLKSGASERSLNDLSVVQMFYENEDGHKEMRSDSKFHGCIIHDFEVIDGAEGRSNIFLIKHFDSKEDIDDNETVLADSSPCKAITSPRSEGNVSSPKNKLSIDTIKANTMEMTMGPLTAPTYNSTAVQQFNQNVIRQQQMRSQSQASINRLSIGEIPVSQQPQIIRDNSNIQPGANQIQFNMNQFRAGMRSTHNVEAHSISPTIQGNTYVQQNPMLFETSTPARQNSIVSQHSIDAFSTTSNNTHSQQPQIIINNQAYPQMEQAVQKTPIPMQTPINTLVQPPVQLGVPVQQPNYYGIQPKSEFPVPVPSYNTMDMASIERQGFFNSSNPYPAFQMGIQPSKDLLKENNNSKNIKFGPILGYDPSKDPDNSVSKAIKPSKNGLHRFPINTQIMYKPKKK